MRLSATSLTALAVALLLASLSLVTWRQSRALEALADLDALQRQISLVEADRAELQRRIQVLESRSRVVQDARERLDMRTPRAEEIVLLPSTVPGGSP
jgi:cell division protein FtsL